ncbi:MAG: sigma-70 family RNA polymerase sigma factor, partial [Victivallales bacterium]|nr:sigma-70 family RNA polymerase sigma factor [Victivallales bacterium]
ARTLLRKRAPELMSEGLDLTLESMESCHSELIDRKYRSELVRTLVSRLPVKLREVCTLYYLSECSCAQIASILGMNENAVKVSLHRVRKKLLEFWWDGGYCHV